MYEILIAPSVLAADFTRLGEQVTEALDAGAHMLHVDVMDGRFVPNITFGPLVVEALRRVTDAPLDVHLMIVEPERYIKQFAQAGASTITVHIEAAPHLHRVLEQIKAQPPVRPIETFVNETNVKYTWDPYERRHQNTVGTLFQASVVHRLALLYKGCRRG